MPIYEYKCLECGSSIEKMQKLADAPLTVCEKCGGKLEKQVSLSGFQFKGAGWYVTDYAGKKNETGAPAKSDNTAPAKTEKSSSNESTAKTETASKPTKSSESNTKKD